jgi:uroporphyrinogen decarboxylase
MGMTPRERILCALNRERPDRTPTDGWFHPEVQRMLKAHYGTEDWDEVLAELGVEGWASCGIGLQFPEWELKHTARPGGQAGAHTYWIDEDTHEDGWGVRQRIGAGGWYEEWIDGPLTGAQTVADIEACPLPTAENIAEPDSYAERVEALKAQDKFVSGGIPNPYKMAWMLRGMDNVLADYLIHRDLLEALYDRLYALYTDIAVRMARGGVDMITITGDIAMQDRIIMGPDTWRAVDKPRLQALIDACRAANPDVLFYIHSDGDVSALMPDIVDMGFDVVNPLQPECIDPAAVKREFGDRIALHGGISLQRTLPFGTVDDVRAEVEALIRSCGYDGGLVVFPSNVIQPDTPVENIIACFHAARDFDLSQLHGPPA